MPDQPFDALIDLDAGSLPRLTVRSAGLVIDLRRPEALTLAEAIQLGRLLDAVAGSLDSPTSDNADSHADDAIATIVRLVGPELGPLLPGHQRRIVDFYLEQIGAAIERLGDEAALPFARRALAPPTTEAAIGETA